MKKILMVTLSKHASFQDGVFSMYEFLKNKTDVWTLTRKNDDYPAPHDAYNFFVNAPENPGLGKGSFRICAIKKMMTIVKSLDFDVVYLESFHFWNYPIMLYARRHKKIVAHALNDVIIHDGDSHVGLKNILNASIVKLSDRVVMRSANGLENAKERFPKSVGKMTRADLWYSFAPYREVAGEGVLFFGRMNRYKGIEQLYEIAQTTSEVQYIVAGKADDADMDLIDRIAMLPNVKLENHIIPYNDMHDYFYRAKVVILPYQSATQSGVILDANRHSRPAIAFHVGALGEQIKDNETGYLVQPGDIQGFADKIRYVLNMPQDEYEAVCKKAYEFAADRYSAQAQADQFIDAIGAR